MSLTHRTLMFLAPGTLVCVGLLGGQLGEAGAKESTAEDTRATIRGTTPELPRGVRRHANGRYTKAMCDETSRHHCLGRWLLPEDWRPGMEIPKRPQAGGAAMAPADVIAAYKIPSGSAANGKIVAIVDEPDSKAFDDLTAYRAHFKLPALPKCAGGLPDGKTPCFAQVAQDGGPSTGTDPDQDADGETSLDMDMISAACPDCSILLVEFANNCQTDFTEAVATAAKLGAVATSISFGGPESTDPNAAKVDAGDQDSGPSTCPSESWWTHDQPGPFSQPGHLVFVASGDFGYDNINIQVGPALGAQSPSWPSSSPWVVAVGGTMLIADGSGGYGEAVWNDDHFNFTQTGQDVTTSGCSTEFAMPPWQSGFLSGSGCAKRATADLAAAAAFTSGGMSQGIALYQGGLTAAEGTSAASPLVAAIFARLGLTTEASNDLSWIQKNAAAFNDVGSPGYPIPTGGRTTDAPKTATCGILCNAGTGWDGPTGVGTPNGAALAKLPVSTSGPVPYPDPGVSIQGDGGIDSGITDDGGTSGGADSGLTNPQGTDSGAASDADGGDGDSSGSSSSGCSFAPSEGASLAGLGFLGMAVTMLAGRRRKTAKRD